MLELPKPKKSGADYFVFFFFKLHTSCNKNSPRFRSMLFSLQLSATLRMVSKKWEEHQASGGKSRRQLPCTSLAHKPKKTQLVPSKNDSKAKNCLLKKKKKLQMHWKYIYLKKIESNPSVLKATRSNCNSSRVRPHLTSLTQPL